MASCIEEYQIESFEICLSEWSIIPHAEAMELQWWKTQSRHVPQREDEVTEDDLTVQQREEKQQQEDYEAMVEDLEKRGRERQRSRREKLGLEPLRELEDDYVESDETTLYREFDGPCVLCLEPDMESREDLLTLRSVLQQEAGMAPYSPFCPTATADPSIPPVARFADFRPVIPIASFGTVTEAIPVAQKLGKVWKPLTWEVTDLHLLASQAMVAEAEKTTTGEADDNYEDPSMWLFRRKVTAVNQDDSMLMGCSAMVMLYGEEMEMDDELNREVANLVAQTGLDGGFIQQSALDDSGIASSVDGSSGSTSGLNLRNGETWDIEAYLNDGDEDSHDEGTVVVIGRVHFFTGDARIYQGMPAVSTRQASAPSRKTDARATEDTLLDENKDK